MIPVAALLIVLVALFTLAVLINNSAPIAVNPNGTLDLSIFGARIAVTEFGLFCTGTGAMLVLVIALVLLRGGLRRARISRRERKNLLSAASGQGKITRREPSTRVLPGRAGAVTSEIAEPDRSSSEGTSGASVSERPSARTDLPKTTDISRAASSSPGAMSDSSGKASKASGQPPAAPGAGSETGGTASDSTRATARNAEAAAESESSGPPLSVRPMTSPPPER